MPADILDEFAEVPNLALEISVGYRAEIWVAERVGFEPTLLLRVNTLSKRAPSATRPSLHANLMGNLGG